MNWPRSAEGEEEEAFHKSRRTFATTRVDLHLKGISCIDFLSSIQLLSIDPSIGHNKLTSMRQGILVRVSGHLVPIFWFTLSYSSSAAMPAMELVVIINCCLYYIRVWRMNGDCVRVDARLRPRRMGRRHSMEKERANGACRRKKLNNL